MKKNLTKTKKFFNNHFSLASAIFSSFVWTLVVGFLELTLFSYLFQMTWEDVKIARTIGFLFNFFVGGFYQSIMRWLIEKKKIPVQYSKYGAIALLKLIINFGIYSFKVCYIGWADMNWDQIILKATIVVLFGTLIGSWYQKGDRIFVRFCLKKYNDFQRRSRYKNILRERREIRKMSELQRVC